MYPFLAIKHEYRNITIDDETKISTLFAGNLNSYNGTILFLHGAPFGSWTWMPLIEFLYPKYKDFRFVAPDLRG
jgi:pimeloyl-ACP methyl ester carboxylesterase